MDSGVIATLAGIGTVVITTLVPFVKDLITTAWTNKTEDKKITIEETRSEREERYRIQDIGTKQWELAMEGYEGLIKELREELRRVNSIVQDVRDELKIAQVDLDICRRESRAQQETNVSLNARLLVLERQDATKDARLRRVESKTSEEPPP